MEIHVQAFLRSTAQVRPLADSQATPSHMQASSCCVKYLKPYRRFVLNQYVFLCLAIFMRVKCQLDVKYECLNYRNCKSLLLVMCIWY